MGIFLFTLGAFAAVACFDKPAVADRQWCAYYDGCGGGATNCGFSTYHNAWRPRPGLVRRVGQIHITKACRGPLPLAACGATLIKRLTACVKTPVDDTRSDLRASSLLSDVRDSFPS
jgi:hypothetical protein